MAAAVATTTLRIGSHVFANGYRHPVILAQEAGTLDLLSDGRLEFGIGAGWLPADYEAAGIPFYSPGERVSRLAEAVRLIKLLFQDAPVTFPGMHYQAQDLNLNPKPKQRPHPPIFVGGGGQRILSLAAREADIVSLDIKGRADGTLDLTTMTADAMDGMVASVRQAAGSRFGELELHSLVHVVSVTHDRNQGRDQLAQFLGGLPPTMVGDTRIGVEQALDSPHVLIGSTEHIVETLQARRERYGISYITVFAENMDALSGVVARLAGK
jgi:probable F420-dependent oxidoreductase